MNGILHRDNRNVDLKVKPGVPRSVGLMMTGLRLKGSPLERRACGISQHKHRHPIS